MPHPCRGCPRSQAALAAPYTIADVLMIALRSDLSGYYISIPSAVERIDSFQRLAATLPLTSILTETDSPYMGPEKGARNEPATVPRGVAAIAAARNEPLHHVTAQIRENFRLLFGV